MVYHEKDTWADRIMWGIILIFLFGPEVLLCMMVFLRITGLEWAYKYTKKNTKTNTPF